MSQTSKLEISIFLTIVVGMLVSQGDHLWQTGTPLIIGLSLSLIVQQLFRWELDSFYEGEFSKNKSVQKPAVAFGFKLPAVENTQRERDFLAQINERNLLSRIGSFISVAAVFVMNFKMGISPGAWPFGANILTIFWFARAATLHHYCLCFMLNACGVLTCLASGKTYSSFLPLIYLALSLYSFYRYKIVNTEAALVSTQFSVRNSWYRPIAFVFPHSILILGLFWIFQQIIPPKAVREEVPKTAPKVSAPLSQSKQLEQGLKSKESVRPRSFSFKSELEQTIAQIKKGEPVSQEKLEQLLQSVKEMEASSPSKSFPSKSEIEQTITQIKKGEPVSQEKLEQLLQSAKEVGASSAQQPSNRVPAPPMMSVKRNLKPWFTKERMLTFFKFVFWIVAAWFLFGFLKKVQTAPTALPDSAQFGDKEKNDFLRLYVNLKKKRLSPQMEIQALYRLFLNLMAWTQHPRPSFFPTEKYTQDLKGEFPDLAHKLSLINHMFCKSIYSSSKIANTELEQFRSDFDLVFRFFLTLQLPQTP